MNQTRRKFLANTAAATAAVAFCGKGLRAQAQPPAAAWPPDATRLAADPLRPQFHLLPRYGWMNDPNAPVFWHGKYHMFFQYNPGAATWGDMHWDHAISDDMVHWQHLPVALAPSAGSYDADGCFTGSFVDPTGKALTGGAAIIYTGVQSVSNPKDATLRDGTHNFRETQCLATTTDPLLRSWKKLPAPVIATPPAGMDVTGFRDPSIWQQDGYFYMTVGSGVRHKGGCVLLYRSVAEGPKALKEWEYLHPVYEGEGNGKSTPDSVDSGEMWECPELFPVGEHHVLIYSTERKVYWVTGHLDPATQKFHKLRQGLLDGGNYYAPKTQRDARGNRILWGWISESRTDDQMRAAGWSGCISLPRVLGVDKDGFLTMTPAAQVLALRGNPAMENERSGHREIADGSRCEVRATLSGDHATLQLADTKSDMPWLQISLHAIAGGRELRAGDRTIALDGEGDVDLHAYVDASVVEIFANNRACLTVRVYQPMVGALRVETANVKQLEMWQMKTISSNRLTI